jgi:DNA (cytosine-5)-methyltransferase 3A
MDFKVLSLFDGLSGGQLALRGLGILPTRYYASEIDPFAVEVTQTNFPNTVQLGEHILSFAPFAQHDNRTEKKVGTTAVPV